MTEADDTSSALSSEKLYSETADTKPQKFGDSLVQHIFSSKKLKISTAGRIGMANCLGDSGAKRNSCDRFFSRNVAQRWAGKSDGNHQERKSINCKTDSPRKRQLYEKNPNKVLIVLSWVKKLKLENLCELRRLS